MSFTIVPPKESITPRRKQKFYDFAVATFEYGEYLEGYKETEEFGNLSTVEKDLIQEEIEKLEDLNEFQVAQIENY